MRNNNNNDIEFNKGSRSNRKPKRKKGNNKSVNRNRNYKDEGLMTSLNTPNVITDGSKDNDPKWYMNLDPIAKDYASLPMSQVLGLGTKSWTRLSNPNYGNAGTARYAAGIMTIDFIPTIGDNSSGATAPVNLAAQELYTLVRRANSGAKNYDKTDLMMVILAMDSAYMLYEDLLRAYRVISTFSSVNRYYPNTVLAALGYDSSLTDNIAQFRGILDVFAYKLASINIPDQLDLIKRHSWMCSNIYLDMDDVKAQSYAFKPTHLYRWTEGADATPTSLKMIDFHSASYPTMNLYTLSSITTLINSIMNPLLGSEDVGVITGDMLKAFGQEAMIKIKPVEEYAAINPVYSEEVIMQIRNTFCMVDVQSSVTGGTGDITQVLSSTIKGPYLEQKLFSHPSDGKRRLGSAPLLNFIREDATPENVLVATRLISTMGSIDSNGNSPLLYYGTEVVESNRIWILQDNSYTSYAIDQDLYFASGADQLTVNNNLNRLHYWSQFDNAPAIYLYTSPATPDEPENYMGAMTDLCNYIYLDDETLRRLHEVATMSLFTVKDYKLSF